ncbi:uncharacterized protein [Amphiura filiformis]|uniref:uncharacterized protein n=1 Tax=Amphiura filiformis TaxID=82378 RepID=UPI003B216780
MATEESTAKPMLFPAPEEKPVTYYNPQHSHEEYLEYSTVGLVIIGLISIGILVIGLGIFLKYVLDSKATLRRLSISSQYSQTHKGRPTNHLPTVPSGVMLLVPDEVESP